MNHEPTAPSDQSAHHPIKPVGDYIDSVLVDTRKNVLRCVLSEKSKDELIDALFEIVYLSDLLDFFKDDMDRHLAECSPQPGRTKCSQNPHEK